MEIVMKFYSSRETLPKAGELVIVLRGAELVEAFLQPNQNFWQPANRMYVPFSIVQTFWTRKWLQ